MAVITISRQFGAGERELGHRIADKLGYYYADEDKIERVAVEANVSPDWMKSIEKETGGKLQKYISKLNPFGQSLMERPLNDKQRYIDGFKYVELMHTIITRIAEEGNAVIVGRGGQYVLQDFEGAYHLLLIADEKDRIRLVETSHDFSNTEAANVVKRMAKRRANLYSFFGRKDYDDSTLYHMVLNMSKLSMEEAEELIFELIKQ
jgi:cytidylate kinase